MYLGSAHPAFALRLYWSRGWWWELSVVLVFEDRVVGCQSERNRLWDEVWMEENSQKTEVKSM